MAGLLDRVDPKTLRQTTVDSLRRAILDGVWEPGVQLNQVLIAERLGVSRGPVREALSQLEQEGLVRNVPRKGAFVTDITPVYIEELYSVRRALEVFAVERAARCAEPVELAHLQGIVDEMRAAAGRADERELAGIDLRFHAQIVASAHHTLLVQMWKSIEVGVRRCVGIRHRIYDNPLDIVGSHPDIFNAIKASDARAAGELLDIHIREAGELLCRLWSNASVAAKGGESAAASRAAGH